MNDELSTSWHSYPHIFALGHRALSDAFKGDVLVEEKVDGSQFSFGRFGDRLRVRSRNKELVLDEPEKMFAAGVETARALSDKLHDGWTYRGEYLAKPHHNGLAYDRIPSMHVMLFDVNTGHEVYLGYDDKKAEAERLGLECVPLVHRGPMPSADDIIGMIERTSVLGGAHVEGVVVKDYTTFTPDKKAAMGKFVSERFKEVQKREWTKANPGPSDALNIIGESLRTEARWLKAVQHLRERGEYDGSPKDIAALIREVQSDVLDECRDEIVEALWKWAAPNIRRKVVAGLPEWYKEHLMRAGG